MSLPSTRLKVERSAVYLLYRASVAVREGVGQVLTCFPSMRSLVFDKRFSKKGCQVQKSGHMLWSSAFG